MRQDIDLTDFSSGELSAKLAGRIDEKKYFSGCSTLLNMVVMPQGGATRRPGTRYVAGNKNQSGINRPVRFIFSTLQAYILEFSNDNVRIYKDDGVVLNTGTPVDVVTPYAEADIPDLKFTQSADTLYIFHKNYATRTLTRSSHVSWTLATLAVRDGPYLDVNTTTTTLTPSGTVGSITLTASSIAGINGGTGFQPSDVGRLVRIKLYSLWAWCIITVRTDTTHVTATVQGAVDFGAAGAIDGAAWAASTVYQLGAVVTAGGVKYIAVSAGTSAGSGSGPSGTGSQIIDGTIIWRMVGGFDSAAWAASTLFDSGVVCLNGGNYYQCTTAGKSAGSGGPTGTGAGIADGTCVWSYLPAFVFPTATANWALGSWGSALGYPAAGKFWQERLHYVAPASQPNHEDGSVVADFTNMAPTTADGTVTDANALSWTLDDDQVNAIHSLSPAGSAQAMQLALFTDAGEHILQAASTAQALTPTSVQAYRETSYGSATVDPLRIGKVVLFTDHAGRKLREFAFYWQSNGYIAPDLLEFSDHITRAPVGADPSLSGIKWMVYQQSPYQVIWAGLNNGKLISFTYDRDQQIFAPAQHQLGGDYYGGPPVVEWGDVIPSPDGTYDELWLSVLRTVNGAPVRFMEVMTRYFDGADPDTAFFVDAGLSSDLNLPAATLTMTGLTQNNPPDVLPETMPPSFSGTGTFTASANAFTSGMAGNAILRCNAGKVLITGYTDARHVTGQVLRPLLSTAPCAANAWSCTLKDTSFAGLDHLDSENVVALGDGAVLDEQVVASGTIAVSGGASLAVAGLPYTPLLIGMPFEPQRAAAASSQGKMKRIDTLWLRLYESLGCSFGMRMTDDMTGAIYDKTEMMQMRSAANAMDNAPPLFTGIRELAPQGSHDREGQIIITQQDPLPLTVVALFARGDVQQVTP
jgi:hypothetical protein